MAIINLCNVTDKGATGSHNGAGYPNRLFEKNADGSYIYVPGPTAYWTRLSHEGLCLRDYERNGYDDSDFHMIVWNVDRNEPEDICFASTRGWSYPCYGSWVDATPEVVEKYNLYKRGMTILDDMRNRSAKARQLREFRKTFKAAAIRLGFDYVSFARAYRNWGTEKRAKIEWLLTANIRSGFKHSMRGQVVAWINASERKYDFPLSTKQAMYL